MKNNFDFHYVALINLIFASVVNAYICQGPRTSTELANELWGPSSNYSQTILDRPNVALESLNNSIDYPSDNIAPDVVSLQMDILSIREINQKTGEFEMILWLRQRWHDFRLEYKTKKENGCLSDSKRYGFSSNHLENIWTPDIFPINSVKTPDRIANSFWVHPNGTVDYAEAVMMSLSCHLDFKTFPRDTQYCKAVLGTFQEDASEVKLQFREDLPPITRDNPAESFSDTIEWNISPREGNVGEFKGEQYLTFNFMLERNSEYYMHFVIGPVLLMITISWSSFFVDRGAVPARVTLTTISFLTVTNFLATHLAVLPRLGGHDVWLLQFMIMSIVFTFLSVIEYVMVNYLYRVERRLDAQRKSIYETKSKQLDTMKADSNGTYKDEYSNNITVDKKDLVTNGAFKIDRLLLKKDGTMRIKDQHLDVFCRWAYPTSFTIAFLILWSTSS